MRVPPGYSCPQTRSSSRSRETTTPVFAMKNASRSNSFAVSSTGLPVDGDVVRLAVEHDVAERERVAALLRLRAAEDRLHARDELAGRERLRQIVVGADLEADDAVGLLVAGGQHQDRHLRAARGSRGRRRSRPCRAGRCRAARAGSGGGRARRAPPRPTAPRRRGSRRESGSRGRALRRRARLRRGEWSPPCVLRRLSDGRQPRTRTAAPPSIRIVTTVDASAAGRQEVAGSP